MAMACCGIGVSSTTRAWGSRRRAAGIRHVERQPRGHAGTCRPPRGGDATVARAARPEKVDRARELCGDAAQGLRVARDEGDERVGHRQSRRRGRARCRRAQIVRSSLVQHHEAVVLLHEVVVGHSAARKKKTARTASTTGGRRRRRRGAQSRRLRAPRPRGRVGARERAEDVRRVDEHGPPQQHREERQPARDVEAEEQVARRDRADEPDEVVFRADDPAQRDGARPCRFGDELGRLEGRSGHRISRRLSAGRS